MLMRNFYIIITLLFTLGLQAQIKNTVIRVENNELGSIKLYPNPTYDFVTLELQNRQNLKEVEVYNITGRKVSRQNTNRIDFRELPSGTYILKIAFIDGQSLMRKVIKK